MSSAATERKCGACGHVHPEGIPCDVVRRDAQEIGARALQACSEKERVNHPQHYGGDTTYEAIKVIEAWELGFCLGNTVKYICRAGKKGATVEDLKKARWYLDREIQRLEKS